MACSEWKFFTVRHFAARHSLFAIRYSLFARSAAMARRDLLIEPAHHGETVVALEPPDGEMALGDALEVIHEHDIDRGAAEGAQHRHRACGRALADDDAEPRRDLGDETADQRRRDAGETALEQQRRRIGGQTAEEDARRVIAEVAAAVAAILRRAQREHLHTGEPRLERREILAVVPRDIGDRA